MTRYIIITSLFLTNCIYGQHSKITNIEKIIFVTSPCNGLCSSYELQVDSNKKAQLHSVQVYKDIIHYPEIDTNRMGYFKGRVSDPIFDKLLRFIKTLKVDTFSDIEESPLSSQQITIIIYYNKKRKIIKTYSLSKNKPDELISTLFEICEKSELVKTNEKLKIEN